MTLIDFINKYIKTRVDFDGAYGAQCVDLFRQYCKDVLELPHTGAVEGAKDLFEKYDNLPLEKKYFYRRNRLLEASPGDIAVWGATKTNPYGHVAIVVQNDYYNLVVFEQNGFTQEGAKLEIRDKNNLLGYLRLWED